MQGNYVCRLGLAGIAGTLILMAGMAVASAQPEEKNVAIAGITTPTDLVMDARSNAYIADTASGKVYCLPGGGKPVLFATIPGAPTTLAVSQERTLFVGTQSGRVYMITQSGDVAEAYDCRTSIAGLSVDRDGGLVIATTQGAIIKVTRNEIVGE